MADTDDKPATKQDIAMLRGEMKEQVGMLRSEMKEQVAMLRGEMQHMHDELLERLDDRETKLLQAFYSYAESNQKRISAVEEENAALKSRLATIENRLTEVERRLNMPPAA